MTDSMNFPNTIVQRDRRDVIQQVREITGLGEAAINQAIEACKDNTGLYTIEQVISVVYDNNDRNNAQPSIPQSHQNLRASVPTLTTSSPLPTNVRNLINTTMGFAVDIPPDVNNQQHIDEDMQRAILLSCVPMEQSIDETDITKRNCSDEPAGLKNIGNTCWFNSVIQTLYTLPYFRRLILNLRYPESNCLLSNHEQQAIDFTKELRKLFVLMLKSPRRSINPERAIKRFNDTKRLSGIAFSHEDCSEFAIHLIDLVELAFETIKKSLPNLSLAQNPDNPVHSFVTGEVLVKRNENQSIHEPLRQINIQMNDSTNLYDGLETLWLGSLDEKLSNPQSIVEQRWLTRLPPVLFICLNRYQFSPLTKQASKISEPFEFYPELYLDRYMLANENLILEKRNIARTIYSQLHDLEKKLNSYNKYSCNNETFSLTNAIRAVYEYATGGQLNPIESNSTDPIASASTILAEDLQHIKTLLPSWLNDIETKCAELREEIHQLKQKLKQLYDVPELNQTRYTLHAVCIHEGSATSGHFWTYVYHADKQKWYRYNDNEVTESTWADVLEAGIGGQHAENNEDKFRIPSAYLFVYVNSEQRLLSSNIHYNISADLQRTLDEDLASLQQQTENIQLEKLNKDFKDISDQVKSYTSVDKVSTLPIFTSSNAFFDVEILKPVVDQTIYLLKTNETKLLSTKVDRLLHEIVDKEIQSYNSSVNTLIQALPQRDYRLEHILSYFAANRIDMIYQQRVMLDIIRRLPIPKENIRLRMFQMQAQIACHELEMSNNKIQEYENLITNYKDYRSITAAFIIGCELMTKNKYDEAILYFCVACDVNIHHTKQGAQPMRAMNSSILFRTRRLCFQQWNDDMLNRFKTNPNYHLDSMAHKFLNCLQQLKHSSHEDIAFVSEIQETWCSLLDNKVQPGTRFIALQAFLERLLEPPTSGHAHDLSVDKNQLVERYEDTVRNLLRQYPALLHQKTNQQSQSPVRLNSPSIPPSPVQIPIIVNQRSPNHHQSILAERASDQEDDDEDK